MAATVGGTFAGLARGLRQRWIPTSTQQLLQAQDALLQHASPLPLSSRRHTLSNDHVINTVEVRSRQPELCPHDTLVLAHGFGAGLGFFYGNIAAMTSSYKRVIAVDWLGMGGSSRPDCRQAPIRRVLTCSPCASALTTDEAVDFFIDPLEEVLETLGLEQVHLAGHSLGGYLAARYALKYESRLQSLCLASPVGLVQKRPQNDSQGADQKAPLGLRLLDAAWSANVTPQWMARMLGPARGRKLVERAVSGRFAGKISEPELQRLLSEYLYHITVARGSGEFAMNSILTPNVASNDLGVFARQPLNEDLKSLSIPLHVLYGDNDWLHSAGVPAVMQDLQKQEGAKVKYTIISNAGHHLYMDNSTAFHSALQATPNIQ